MTPKRPGSHASPGQYPAFDTFHNSEVFEDIERLIKQSKVIVIDFDATIAYTEDNQMMAFAAYASAEARKINPDFQELDYIEVGKEMLGKSETEIMSIFKERYGLEKPVEQLVEERGRVYVDQLKLSHVRPNSFFFEVARLAEEQGIPLLVVTNGRDPIQRELMRHWKIDHLITELHASDTMCLDLEDITKRKPTFLRRLPEREGVKPEEILVFEDSKGTCTLAGELGMNAVFIRHNLNPPKLGEAEFEPNTGLVLHCNYLGTRPKQAALLEAKFKARATQVAQLNLV